SRSGGRRRAPARMARSPHRRFPAEVASQSLMIPYPPAARVGGPGGPAPRPGSEAEVFAVVDRHPDLLDAAPPPVVPQQPTPPSEDRIRLIDGVRVPPALAGPDDRVGRVPLPPADPVPRAGQADLGVVPVPEADVEHDVPPALPD